jgi:hypothetical protein
MWNTHTNMCAHVFLCVSTQSNYLLQTEWGDMHRNLGNQILVISEIFFSYCCAGGTLWHFENFLLYINYILLEFTLFAILLYPSFPHFWSSFNKSHFLHLHSCVHSICIIFLILHPFSTSSPFPLVPTTPQTGPSLPSCSPIL